MKLLRDTDAIIWAALSTHRLSRVARDEIANSNNELFVSAASAWEIATKVRLGKLPEAELLEANFVPLAKRAGFAMLPVSVETALRSGRLRGKHADPFDRMIAAQAVQLDVPVISNDTKLDEFGVRRIW